MEFCPRCANILIEKETHLACSSKGCSYAIRKKTIESDPRRKTVNRINERAGLQGLTRDGRSVLGNR
ncbi:MAG: hypothetical protein V1928_01825 [Parcubacteria group bacterium]